MYSLSIKLDTKKIESENKYDLESLYDALDYMFEESLGLERQRNADNLVVYSGKNNDKNDTYARIAAMCISLKNNCVWFTDNVLQWELFSPDTGSENLIEVFMSQTV